MKKTLLCLCFLFASVSVFAETWTMTDQLGDMAIWTKSSGSIPTEYFSFSCVKGCSGVGTGIMHTTTDNFVTAEFDFHDMTTGASYVNIYIGKKDGKRVSGRFSSVNVDKQWNPGYVGVWNALISDGEDKK